MCNTGVMTFIKSDNDKVRIEALRQLTVSTNEISVAYDDLAAKYQAQSLELLALKASGLPMPTNVPTGWKIVFAEDFNVPCAEGQFEATYVPRGMGFYKDGWLDTSKHGAYSSKLISVQNSVCSIRMLGPTATTPLAQVASIYPQMRGLTSVIFEERLRYSLTPGFKVAHLMWPDSGLKYPDGEMDWPESTGTNSPGGFVHYKGGVVNNDQAVFKTTADPRQWHTYRREWEAGVYVRYILDGVLVGEVTGAKVPSTPFHFSLQNETALGGVIPTSADHGLIETDWMRVLIKA